MFGGEPPPLEAQDLKARHVKIGNCVGSWLLRGGAQQGGLVERNAMMDTRTQRPSYGSVTSWGRLGRGPPISRGWSPTPRWCSCAGLTNCIGSIRLPRLGSCAICYSKRATSLGGGRWPPDSADGHHHVVRQAPHQPATSDPPNLSLLAAPADDHTSESRVGGRYHL